MNIHGSQHMMRGGTPPNTARAALILLHGRGASAEDILSLGEEIAAGVPCVALLAPQAAGSTWYPQRFLAPLEQNEPHLGSALEVVGRIVHELGTAGLPPGKILIAGFSQGACLALEYAARHPQRYGGIAGLSGALIGPPGGPRQAAGSLEGTPVYIGCSDIDVHIPLGSVEESATWLAAHGADVTKTIFHGMGHTVNAEEIAEIQGILSAVEAGA